MLGQLRRHYRYLHTYTIGFLSSSLVVFCCCCSFDSLYIPNQIFYSAASATLTTLLAGLAIVVLPNFYLMLTHGSRIIFALKILNRNFFLLLLQDLFNCLL